MSGRIKQILFRYRYVFILLMLMGALTVATPHFFTFTNLVNVMWSVSTVGIIAIGATFVMLVGKIDLSVGSVAALVGIVCTRAILERQTPLPLAIGMAILVGALAGLCNGALVAHLRIPEFVATFATSSVITGIAQFLSDGKTIGIMEPKGYIFLGTGKLLGVPMPVIIFAFMFCIGFFILNCTVFGRNCYLAGGNPLAARLSGVRVKRTLLMAYVVTGIGAGIGGVVLNALTQQANSSMGSGYDMDVISAIVIGGTSMSGGVGTMPGTLFGVVLVGLINNGMNLLNVPGAVHPIVKGLIIVGAVALNSYTIRLRQRQKA